MPSTVRAYIQDYDQMTELKPHIVTSLEGALISPSSILLRMPTRPWSCTLMAHAVTHCDTQPMPSRILPGGKLPYM